MTKCFYLGVCLLATLCLAFSIQEVQAQHKKYAKHASTSVSVEDDMDFSEVIRNGDCLPGKLILKLKPEFKDADVFNTAQWMQAAGKYQTQVPSHYFNLTNFNKRAQKVKPSVDLSLMYGVDIDTNVDMQMVINNLMATGMFEYVQPSIIYKLASYVPDDDRLRNQYYLETIKAFDAWGITKGDTSIIIGIVDSGHDFNHPDFEGQFAYNYNDPINGIDDDGDGYVDNFMGWDFAGPDGRSQNNDPQLPTPGIDHGIGVGGCSSATPDNGIGIAGVGFNCKILSTKHSPDNQPNARAVIDTYSGVLYVAEMGAQVINGSWGGYRFDPAMQNIANYVTNDLGALFIAAAGNEATNALSYPAALRGVMGVGATTRNDVVSGFSNYGSYVDIMAPGSAIYTLEHSAGNMYGSTQGTSFASPIVAGAAGLVRSRFPELHPLKVLEQLKATADNITDLNPNFRGQIGGGRLNAFRAVSETPPSIYLIDRTFIVGDKINTVFTGDVVEMEVTLENRLWRSDANLVAKISTRDAGIEFQNAQISVGVLDEDARVTPSERFRFKISDSFSGRNRSITLRLDFEQEGYNGQTFVTLIVNPDFTIIDENQITTSIDNAGTIGVHAQGTQGVGLIFNGQNILSGIGLMAGNSADKVISAAPGENNEFRQDFRSVRAMRDITNDGVPYRILEATFTDVDAGNRRNNVEIRQRIITRMSQSNDQFIIVEYEFWNRGSGSLSNFHAGLLADWDIPQFDENRLGWDAVRKLGYAYTDSEDTYAGLRLLGNNNALHTAFAFDASFSGTPFGLSNGFTDSEKFDALIGRFNNETMAVDGNPTDVAHVLAERIPLTRNERKTVTFAIVVGNSLRDLQNAADEALNAYEIYSGEEINATIQERELAAAVNVFPNPHTGNFSLRVPQEFSRTETQVSVVNSLGQIVWSRAANPNAWNNEQMQIELHAIPNGLYFIRLQNSEFVVNKPMIKE
ncbi:MAG: S8 family peptidase [Bernardetiaceae bacterium]|nr:S8 family peptidase [Bernardetiaceae bacterium]